MKVIGREAGDARQFIERERVAEMLIDVIEDAQHALFVIVQCGCSHSATPS
jgi:hypothetical protein